LEYGVIVTDAGMEHARRLLAVHNEISKVLNHWRPRAGAIEKLYFAKNSKTAMPVGEARGVLFLALAQAELPVFEYSPNEIKMAITGTGSAEKHQVQEMVRLILGLDSPPRPDHAADALGAAICCAHNLIAY
jgi:crossover junction endodeoxyribonuclease RuvC